MGFAEEVSQRPSTVAQQLKAEVKELKKKLTESKRRERKKGEKIEGLTGELAKKTRELEDALASLKTLKRLAGKGLSRATALNYKWHMKNPKACLRLFGFRTFKELVLYAIAFFMRHDGFPRRPKLIFESGLPEAVAARSHLTQLEGAMATRVRLRTAATETILALIFDVDQSTMNRQIRKWAPRWGYTGKLLSQFRGMTKGQMMEMRPLQLGDGTPCDSVQGVQTAVASLDGWDGTTDSPRENQKAKRASYSNKMHCEAVRGLTWCACPARGVSGPSPHPSSLPPTPP